MELKGDTKTEPIPLMRAHLLDNISAIIKESVMKAVHNYVAKDNKLKNIYCGEGETIAEIDSPCGCE
jgi:hypothetical protein